MPTIVGMRRRGYTPEAIRTFCDRIGVAKRENLVDVALLEHAVREDLNTPRAARDGRAAAAPGGDRELPGGQVEEFEIVNNPEDAAGGQPARCRSRACSTSSATTSWRAPPKKFFRLAPGREVRLRGAYFVTCTGVDQGRRRRGRSSCAAPTIPRRAAETPPTAARSRRRCTGCPPRTPSTPRCGSTTGCSRAKRPDAAGDYRADLNPASLEVVSGCKLEPSVADAPAGTRYQFERLGYFCVDPDSRPGSLVFNRTVTLKDSWAQDRGGREPIAGLGVRTLGVAVVSRQPCRLD